MAIRKMWVDGDRVMMLTARGQRYWLPLHQQIDCKYDTGGRGRSRSTITVHRVDSSGHYLWVTSPGQRNERPIGGERAKAYATRVMDIPSPTVGDGRIHIAASKADAILDRLEAIESKLTELLTMWRPAARDESHSTIQTNGVSK